MNYGEEESPMFHSFIYLDVGVLSITLEINSQSLIQRWITQGLNLIVAFENLCLFYKI